MAILELADEAVLLMLCAESVVRKPDGEGRIGILSNLVARFRAALPAFEKAIDPMYRGLPIPDSDEQEGHRVAS